MPLLNSVLDMDIPENDFISSLQPQYRKSALTALFEDCLRAASKEAPILIVVEDVHWIDALSHDLLEDLAKVLVECPVCFVLAYRPPQLMRLQAPRLEVLPQFTKIELHELSRLEAEQAIRAKPPEDVVPMVLCLLGPDSGATTGQAFNHGDDHWTLLPEGEPLAAG